jgi:rare lipoprotein A
MIKIMIVLLSLLVPKVDTKPYPTEFGIASWYGPGFHGRQTASGVLYDQNLMVAAHKTLPFGTVARVTNLENGLQVEVCVVDRGPYVKGRVIDLSASAAKALDMRSKGTARVRIEDLGVIDVD